MWKVIDIWNKNEAEAYEAFVRSHINGSFMQSISWAEFKANWKHEAVMVTDDKGNVKGAALILIKKIPLLRTAFFYCPRGPVCDYNDKETLSEVFEAIGELAKKYHAYEFKTDPCVTEDDTEYIDIFRDFGFRFRADAPELSTIQARNSYMLFFNGRSKDELFASFHSKWRYNIRVALKKGVECRVCGKEAVGDFYSLMKETGSRDGFCIRDVSYFEGMLDRLGDSCRLYMCYCGGIPLSGAVCVRYAGKSHYVYGASTAQMRNVMPNYLMQWTMICDAVDSGCYVHDFMGIPFYKNPEHPNYGVYRFKKGFSGQVVTYAGEFDFIYRPVLLKLSEAGFFMLRQFRKFYTWITIKRNRSAKSKNEAKQPCIDANVQAADVKTKKLLENH